MGKILGGHEDYQDQWIGDSRLWPMPGNHGGRTGDVDRHLDQPGKAATDKQKTQKNPQPQKNGRSEQTQQHRLISSVQVTLHCLGTKDGLTSSVHSSSLSWVIPPSYAGTNALISPTPIGCRRSALIEVIMPKKSVVYILILVNILPLWYGKSTGGKERSNPFSGKLVFT